MAVAEPAALMSAKAYKDKKASPLVEKLKETIKALTIKCVQLAEQGKKLKDKVAPAGAADQSLDR